MKGSNGPSFSILVIVIHQQVFITSLKMQTSFILSWKVPMGLPTFQLPLPNPPSIPSTKLLQAIAR
jgi:hypothetical protein